MKDFNSELEYPQDGETYETKRGFRKQMKRHIIFR